MIAITRPDEADHIAVDIHDQQLSSAEWLAYFRYNQQHLLPLPWTCPYRLSEPEKAAIASSIRTFQLGESSEGCHLLRAARHEAERSGDFTYIDALKLFIKEEQRHAANLGQFMEQQKINLAEQQWTDTLFRKLRRLVNLELAIVVLLSAELIATVYYQALQTATASPLLQQICTQILQDEAMHVVFQSSQLGRLRQSRCQHYCTLTQWLHGGLYGAILLIIWLEHGSVFRAGGYSLADFWEKAWAAWFRAFRIIKDIAQSSPAITD